MARTNLSALVVNIEADIRNLKAGLKLAEGDIAGFEKKAVSAGSRFRAGFTSEIDGAGAAFRKLRSGALAIGTLALALGAGTKAALAMADNVGELAARSGTAVEEFQRLSFAAEQGGASTEVMSGALAKLGKNIAEAVAGTSAGNKFLRDTHLALRDITDQSGRALEAADVMSVIAKRMQDASSDAERLRIAFGAFGRGAGAALVPVMENLDEVKKRANVFTDEQVERAGEMNDKLDELAHTIKVEFAKALISTGPELIKFMETMAKVSHEVRMIIARWKGDDLSEDVATVEQLQARINGFKSDLRHYQQVFEENSRKAAQMEKEGKFGLQKGRALEAADEISRVEREIARIQAEIRRRSAEEEAERAEAVENQKTEIAAAAEERRAAIREKWSKIQPDIVTLGDIERPQRQSDKLNEEWVKSRQEAASKDYVNRLELEKEIADEQRKLDEERFEKLLDLSDEFAQEFSRGFADAALSGEDAFDNILESFKRMIIEMAAQELIARPLQEMFAGVLSGATGQAVPEGRSEQSAGSALFSTVGGAIKNKAISWGIGKIFGFAGGGRPPMGRPSMVGERGPELFVPDQPGRVMPISTGSAGGAAMARPQVNVSVNHAPGTTSRVQQKPNGDIEVMVDQVESALARRVGRGGKLAGAINAQTGTTKPPIQGIG